MTWTGRTRAGLTDARVFPTTERGALPVWVGVGVHSPGFVAETVAQRVATVIRMLRLDRFDLKYSSGPQPHRDLRQAIELYGTVVVPRVRELLAG